MPAPDRDEMPIGIIHPKADIAEGNRHVRFVPILLQKSVAGFFGW